MSRARTLGENTASPILRSGDSGLRRRTRRDDSNGSNTGGGRVLGGGLCGANLAAADADAAANGGNDEDEDPLLEPVTSAAIISHCAASDVMSNPRNMIKKSLLLSTIMAAKDIRQWRAIVVRKNVMDDATAQGTRTKQELFDALMRECPFC